jgi:hypothetical protein
MIVRNYYYMYIFQLAKASEYKHLTFVSKYNLFKCQLLFCDSINLPRAVYCVHFVLFWQYNVVTSSLSRCKVSR